ncbi:SDR family NAD(P)-dependent oxidoreductase [Sphingopyxis sp. PET50]|uniref:SDR family NAD(P)-dependent oxidoreductase n=1 Tax=Sphingopyxis sp. PET50 TaxID=2976533 RepID=UPI0021AFA3F3|nr:SDR family oxidoreductase [Sphingopyxis sp. PET50]
MFSLAGKTIVITGGGRGIGRGIARACAKAGANLVITGRTQEPLEETAAELADLGADHLLVPGDIMSQAALDEIVAKTVGRFGPIDGWVNNAGSANAADVGPMLRIDEGQWDRVVDLNLKWTFFAMQAAAKAMAARGGSIVNLSSRSGSQPCPPTAHYGAAKAGVDSLTATAAVEWGHLGIRVNAIAPGVVLTENSQTMADPARRKRQVETVPLQRLGTVDDVGPLAVYFLSDESAWVSGTVVPVNGGSRIPVGLLTYLHHRNKDIAV